MRTRAFLCVYLPQAVDAMAQKLLYERMARPDEIQANGCVHRESYNSVCYVSVHMHRPLLHSLML
jgi:hypothetical protein